MILAAKATGFAACCAGLLLRYYHAFPMLPMYVALHGTTCILGGIWLWKRPECHAERLLLPLVILLLCTVQLLFPKDFYLPFRRSATLWAHAFLLASIAARAMFMVSGMEALGGILAGGSLQESRGAFNHAVYGFFWLTISIFCGEIWSLTGWGTPVIWHDPAITSLMAMWFYWVAVLHMHYTGTWAARLQPVSMAAGGLLVLVLSCISDTGPFRGLFQQVAGS